MLNANVIQGNLTAAGFRFAVIAARWNDFLTARLIEGALDTIERLGGSQDSVTVYRVPGSFEIPQAAKKIATVGDFDAIICLGTIIRGQTPHFDFVSGEATKGIAAIGMEYDLPVLYGIITADNLEQAIDRAGVKVGNKGAEAAMAAVEMVNLYREIDNLTANSGEKNKD